MRGTLARTGTIALRILLGLVVLALSALFLIGRLRVEVDLQLTSAQDGRADVLVAITNTTEHDWKGSVDLRFDDTPVPVAIGSIAQGDTEQDTVELRVERGRAYEITGTLLIGP